MGSYVIFFMLVEITKVALSEIIMKFTIDVFMVEIRLHQ